MRMTIGAARSGSVPQVLEEDARRPAPFGGALGSEYDVVLDRAGERLTVKLVRAKRPEEVGEPVTKAPMGSPAEWKCPDRAP